jgi:hypothetical protein
METLETLRKRINSRNNAPAWAARAGLVVVLAGVLTACGGEQAAQPTTAPAATTIPATDATEPADEATAEPAAEETETADVAASPAAMDMASPVAGMATPVADMGTPVADMATPVASMATPLAGMASPVAGMASPVADGEATPVGEAIAYSPRICDSINSWLAQPEVAKVLQQPIWNQIVEEGQKAAAGEPVDVALMKTDFATLDQTATAMRDVASDDVKHGPVAITTQMIGRAARLAGGLADGTETQAEAQAAVPELQSLISAYEADVVAREAACGA